MIRPIDIETVHRIGAGQVIISLTSALKELVENSLDANSSAIDIQFSEYGLVSIQVSDNGIGIHSSDLEFVGKRHFTSKLKEFDDLESISTFGFRGEAINSLSQCSLLTLQTKHKDEKSGFKLLVSQNHKEPIARLAGTTFLITNLFTNLPVRRKELEKNFKKEFQKCIQVLQAYALISTGVKFSCYNQRINSNELIFQTTISNTLKENLISLFGFKMFTCLIPYNWCVLHECIEFKFEGYVSGLEGKCSGDKQFVFINKRPTDQPKIARLFNEIFRMFSDQMYPMFVLSIYLPTDSFDLNVTPDKRTILLHFESFILDYLRSQLNGLYEAELEKKSLTKTAIDKHQKPDKPKIQSNQVLSQSFIVCRHEESESLTRSQSPIDSTLNENTTKQIIKDPFRNEDTFSPICDDSSTSAAFRPLVRATAIVEDTSKPLVMGTLIDESTSAAFRPLVRATAIVEDTSKPLVMGTLIDESADSATLSFSTDECNLVPECGFAFGDRDKLTSDLDWDMLTTDPIPYEYYERIESMLEEASTNQLNEENQQNSLIEEPLSEIKRIDFEKMQVVGQFNLGFIIVKLNSNHLMIIDQHAADEKYNYELYLKETKLSCQPLLVPITLEMSLMDELFVLENLSIFEKNGFKMSFEQNSIPSKRFKLTALPFSKNTIFDVDDVYELIGACQNNLNVRCTKLLRLFASRACRKSVMIGTALKKKEMENIVKNLGKLDKPWNCPHGRPTIRYLCKLST